MRPHQRYLGGLAFQLKTPWANGRNFCGCPHRSGPKHIQGSCGLLLWKLLETPILHEQTEQLLEGHPIFQQHSEKNHFKKGCLKLEVFKLKQAWGENLLNSCSPLPPRPRKLYSGPCVSRCLGAGTAVN